MVANHPQMGHSSDTPPIVASFQWINLGQWLDLSIEPVSNSNPRWGRLHKLGTSVIPHFHVSLSEQFSSCMFFMTRGHLQGQKFNFMVK